MWPVRGYPYRNDKVVTRLWSPCNLVTTLLQPCHDLVVFSQSHCNLAATLSNPSQGCDNLVTTLRQPCHDLVVFSQSHCNLAATLSNPSQGCHKVVTSLSSLPQPCHNLVVYRICSIRHHSRLVAAYNSIGKLN